MTSNYSSNQIQNHYSCSSGSSRASSGQRIGAPKCFFRIQTRVKYSTLGKNPGKDYYNCPNFPNGCEFFCWVENYGEEEDKDAKIRVYDELSIQSLLRSTDCDGARKSGYRASAQHYSVLGFLCGVLVSVLLFLAFFK